MHQINAQLVMQANSLRKIAEQYLIAEACLYRHKRNHLPELHAAMRSSLVVVEARSILRQMRELHQRSMNILARAEQSGQLETALRAVREARGNLELLAKLDGTLAPQSPGGPVSISVTYVDRPQVVVPNQRSQDTPHVHDD